METQTTIGSPTLHDADTSNHLKTPAKAKYAPGLEDEDDQEDVEQQQTEEEKKNPLRSSTGFWVSPSSYKEATKYEEIHLFFVVHGVGATAPHLKKKQKQFADAFGRVLAIHGDKIKKNYHIKMINWKHSLSNEAKRNIERITIDNHESKRALLNTIPTDILFYMVPDHSRVILAEVAQQCNKYYREVSNIFQRVHVSFIAHSLGSVILYDLVTKFITPKEGADDPYPNKLIFPIEHIFNIGSPLGLFLSIATDGQIVPLDQKGICKGFYNIFHPSDLVAYRLEPMMLNYPAMTPPTIASYLAERKDIRKKWWWMDWLFCACRSRADIPEGNMIGGFNGKRYDYMIEENGLEKHLEYVGILNGHFSYWENEDLALFILQKIN